MLELRKFGRADFDRLIGWIPDARFLLQWAGTLLKWPLDKAQLDKHLDDTRGEKPKRYAFKAVHVSDNTPVGHVEVDFIDYDKSTAKLSRVLIGDPENRGKGYGLEMVRLTVDFAFNRICLNAINLGVFDFNKAAISCYKKIGFKECDLREEYNLKEENLRTKFENEYWKLLTMKLLKEDYVKDF